MSLPRGLRAARKNSVWCRCKTWCPCLAKTRADLPGYCIKSSTAQKHRILLPVACVQFWGGFSPGSGHKTKNTTINTNCAFLDVWSGRTNHSLPPWRQSLQVRGRSLGGCSMAHRTFLPMGNLKSNPIHTAWGLITCFEQDVSPWVAKCLQGVNTRGWAPVHTAGLEAIFLFPFNQNLLLLCFLFCLVTEAKLHVPSRGS